MKSFMMLFFCVYRGAHRCGLTCLCAFRPQSSNQSNCPHLISLRIKCYFPKNIYFRSSISKPIFTLNHLTMKLRYMSCTTRHLLLLTFLTGILVLAGCASDDTPEPNEPEFYIKFKAG